MLRVRVSIFPFDELILSSPRRSQMASIAGRPQFEDFSCGLSLCHPATSGSILLLGECFLSPLSPPCCLGAS